MQMNAKNKSNFCSGGDESPTTAVTDLFASLETSNGSGMMGGLDFLNDDFTGYDFDSDCEEDPVVSRSSSTDSCDSNGSGTSSGSSTPPQERTQKSSSSSSSSSSSNATTVNQTKSIKMRQVVSSVHITYDVPPLSSSVPSTFNSGAHGSFRRMNTATEDRILDSLLQHM